MNDFGPGANSSEPWQVSVSDTPKCQGLNDLGGHNSLIIDVLDLTGKAIQMPPKVECFGLWDGLVMTSFTDEGDGFSRFKVTVENQKLATIGEYECLIIVEDVENFSFPDWLNLTAYRILPLVVKEHTNIPPVANA